MALSMQRQILLVGLSSMMFLGGLLWLFMGLVVPSYVEGQLRTTHALGRVLSTIVLKTDPSAMDGMLRDQVIRTPGARFVAVVDLEGVAWAHSDPRRTGFAYDRDLVEKALADKFPIVTRASRAEHSFSGSDHLLSVPMISPAGRTVGAVVVGFDSDRVNALRNSYLAGFFLIAGGWSAMIAWLLRSQWRSALTRMKLVESHLRQQARYRLLVETMNDGLLQLDPQGCIEWANAKAETILGSSLEHLQHTPLGTHLAAEDEPLLQSALAAAFAGEEHHLDVRMARRGGIQRFARLSLRSGGHHQLVVVITDTTTSRLAEERMRQSQKLEAVGRLAGGFAHDFNNLLVPILGNIELALRRVDDDRIRMGLNSVLVSAQRARDLVRQLLAYSRGQVVQFEPVDLSDVVRQFASLLRPTLREDVLLELVVEETGLMLCDPGQIHQALLHLALNAQDAMPQGGRMRIVLRCADPPDPRKILVGQAPRQKCAELLVADEGSGMDAATLNRIFEPFFTTKDVGGGSGLGLYATLGIVQRHSGAIGVLSTPGVGSEFRVFLPLLDSLYDVPGSSIHQPSVPNSKAPRTIVLMEDNDAVREFTAVILTEAGYRVVAMADPRNAIAWFQSSTQNVDLLVTDVSLPGGGGVHLVRRLRASRPCIPILFMSGYPDEELQLQGLTDADTDLLQKPFSMEELLAKVRNLMDRNLAVGA